MSNPTESIKSWVSDLLCLALFFGVFYAIWIGSHALFTPDEGRYSEVAREMIATGDYITPRVNGIAFLDKPILYYWLQASAIHLFGLKEWALRFWPAVMGVLCSLMTYIAGRGLFSRRTGVISAIILACSPLYYGASHYANLDLEVAALLSICLFNTALGLKTQQSRFFIIAYVFSALAFLTKGLIGLAFPAMILFAWMAILNRWNTLKKIHLITGLLLFTVITLPWYVLVQKANPQFLHFFFIDQQVSRFLTQGAFNNRTPMWFYLPIFLAGTFPWSIFIVQAVSNSIKQVWQNRQAHASELFLLLWLLIVFLFFSIPKSKTVGYILPIFPVAALLVGHYLDNNWDKAKSLGLRLGVQVFFGISILLFAGLYIVPHISSLEVAPSLIPYFHLTAWLFLASGIVAIYLLRKNKPFAVIFNWLLVTSLAFLLIMMSSTTALNQKSSKSLALQIRPYLQPSDEVITYFKYYQDLPIYLERRISIVADWQASDIAQRDNWLRELWYGMPFQDTSKWLINEKTFWEKWDSKQRLFVFLNANYLDQFNETAHGKFFKIDQHNDIILVSNQAPPKKP